MALWLAGLIRVNGKTSKTANWTGEIIDKLGGRRWIESGGVRVDRDINGSLGIALKALLAQPA